MAPTTELGRYQVLGEIGRGSTGVVYHARDTLLGREVALKSVRPPASGGEDLRGELLREARSAGMLSHPNVVTIYDVLEGADGTLYIAMEYVEGRSLAAVLAESGPLEFERVVDLVSHIAAALDYLHTMGLVHRDVKPGNILITRDGRVKLADFGIAVRGRALRTEQETDQEAGERAEEEGTVLGTPSYMAPEQILGREITPRTDVWSLGVVLYEMLAGRRPFDGRSVADVVHRIVHGPVPDLGEEQAPPARLRELLERALAKDPRWRFASAGDLARDLRKILYEAAGEAGEQLSEAEMLDRTLVARRASGPAAKLPFWRRPAVLLVLLAALLGGGAFLAAWVVQQEVGGAVFAPEVADLDPRSLEALRLLQQGQRLLAAGDAEGAAVFFAVVERLEPQLPEAERISRLRRRMEAEARERMPDVETVRSALAEREAGDLVASARRRLPAEEGQDVVEARAALEHAGESLAAPPAGAEAATPGDAEQARIKVEFSSEAPEGVLTIYGGGEQLLRRGFSYYEPGWLFGRKASSGGFEEELAVPPEVETLWVYVAMPGTAARRLEVPGTYAPGESRVLRVHVPTEGEATAVLR